MNNTEARIKSLDRLRVHLIEQYNELVADFTIHCMPKNVCKAATLLWQHAENVRILSNSLRKDIGWELLERIDHGGYYDDCMLEVAHLLGIDVKQIDDHIVSCARRLIAREEQGNVERMEALGNNNDFWEWIVRCCESVFHHIINRAKVIDVWRDEMSKLQHKEQLRMQLIAGMGSVLLSDKVAIEYQKLFGGNGNAGAYQFA